MPKIKIANGQRYQRRTASPAAPAKRTENVRAKFVGKATLEQFFTAVQALIAALQDMGVHSVDKGSLYFAPLDRHGSRMDLIDENGEVLEVIEIEIPEAAPVKSNGGIKRLAFPGANPAAAPAVQDNKAPPKS